MKTENKIHSKTPNWKIAQSEVCLNQRIKAENATIQLKYFEVLAEIKLLYQGQGLECFERDYTKFPNGNRAAMHCYLNNEVYWNIICDGCDVFYIQYHCNNCRFAEQIKASLGPLFNSESLVVLPQSNLSLAFELCKDFEDASFFSI